MAAADRHNAITTQLLMTVGRELPTLGSFGAELVVLESVVAGCISSACVRYNKQPEQALEVFIEALKPRLDQVIYGRQQ